MPGRLNGTRENWPSDLRAHICGSPNLVSMLDNHAGACKKHTPPEKKPSGKIQSIELEAGEQFLPLNWRTKARLKGCLFTDTGCLQSLPLPDLEEKRKACQHEARKKHNPWQVPQFRMIACCSVWAQSYCLLMHARL